MLVSTKGADEVGVAQDIPIYCQTKCIHVDGQIALIYAVVLCLMY